MSIPLAAVGALVAALLETSVLSLVMTAGTKPDLVFVLTIVSTMVLGVEDGLTWAFVGGLMLDLLIPERHLGASSLALLLVAGVAIGVTRLLPQRRIVVAAFTVFVLSWAFQGLSTVILAATGGTPGQLNLAAMLPIAILDGALGLAAAAAARRLWMRFAAHDRIEW